MYYITNSMSLYITLIEFRTNGNWGHNVPVHPGLSLLKSQPDNCQVSTCNLHTTSKLCTYSICS